MNSGVIGKMTQLEIPIVLNTFDQNSFPSKCIKLEFYCLNVQFYFKIPLLKIKLMLFII